MTGEFLYDVLGAEYTHEGDYCTLILSHKHWSFVIISAGRSYNIKDDPEMLAMGMKI